MKPIAALLNTAAQRVIVMILLAAVVAILFRDSYASMWALWDSVDHRHGLLIFPISFFLVWRIRHRLADVAVAADMRGLAIVLILAVVWLVARLAGIQVIEHATVLAMIPAVIATAAGFALVRTAMFPLLFLILATPIGESLVPFLMVVTADFSAWLLKASGIPLLRNGQYMSLPGGEFVVADVCSGLRYLLTGGMIALLYGYLTFASYSKRLWFLLGTAVTLVAANGIRAYVVMAVASATNMQYLGGRDHIYFGWLMFGFVMMLIMWLGAKFADQESEKQLHASESADTISKVSPIPLIATLGLAMLAVTVKPLEADLSEFGSFIAVLVAALLIAIILIATNQNGRKSNSSIGSSSSGHGFFSGSRAVVFVLLFGILTFVPRFAATIEDNVDRVVNITDMGRDLPCNVVGIWRTHWNPEFNDADRVNEASLDCSGAIVDVFEGAYASALQGNELVNSSHRILPPDLDPYIKRTLHTLLGENDSRIHVSEIQVESPFGDSLVWHWYEVEGRVSISESRTKFNQLWALLRQQPAGGRVVIVTASIQGDAERTRNKMATVAHAILGHGTLVALVGEP